MQEVAAEEWIPSNHLLQDAVMGTIDTNAFLPGMPLAPLGKREIVNLDYERDGRMDCLKNSTPKSLPTSALIGRGKASGDGR